METHGGAIGVGDVDPAPGLAHDEGESRGETAVVAPPEEEGEAVGSRQGGAGRTHRKY
jgi:hypothetical protein